MISASIASGSSCQDLARRDHDRERDDPTGDLGGRRDDLPGASDQLVARVDARGDPCLGHGLDRRVVSTATTVPDAGRRQVEGLDLLAHERGRVDAEDRGSERLRLGEDRGRVAGEIRVVEPLVECRGELVGQGRVALSTSSCWTRGNSVRLPPVVASGFVTLRKNGSSPRGTVVMAVRLAHSPPGRRRPP